MKKVKPKLHPTKLAPNVVRTLLGGEVVAFTPHLTPKTFNGRHAFRRAYQWVRKGQGRVLKPVSIVCEKVLFRIEDHIVLHITDAGDHTEPDNLESGSILSIEDSAGTQRITLLAEELTDLSKRWSAIARANKIKAPKFPCPSGN